MYPYLTRPKFHDFSPLKAEVDGQPALCFSNGHLEIMSKKDFNEMMELAKRFYDSDGVEEYIEKENAMNRWAGHPVMGTTLVEGKYILPKPIVDRREFRKDLKRNWGFTCAWCNQKVSSKTDKEYFWINEAIDRGEKYINGQCCQSACAENLWYDLIIEWILEQKLTNIFHTDKTIKA